MIYIRYLLNQNLLGYSSSSGLVNGCHSAMLTEDHDCDVASPPPHSTPVMGFQPRGSGLSPPLGTGGVLQYADGPPRLPPEDGHDRQGHESDTEPLDSEARRRIFFSSSSSSSSSSTSSGGSRLHHGSVKQGHHHHSKHHHHHHHHHHNHHSPSSHSQEGRKRGRRKRSSSGAMPMSGSPKRRAFPGLGCPSHSSGSPLNINSMVSR